MERIRFATMSSEKRAERNIKRRERYNSNKKGLYVSIAEIIMLQYTFVSTGTVLAFSFVPLYNCLPISLGQRFVMFVPPGVNVGKPDYDASIWEPDEEMLATQEVSFQYLFFSV